jgi:hypothetical protein
VVFIAIRESLMIAIVAALLGLAGAWIAVNRELRRFSSPR